MTRRTAPEAARAMTVVASLAAMLMACSTGPEPSGARAAPDAESPACAAALAAAPATVADLPRTPISVPGALAWGEPQVVLRCGLPPQPPTTLPCLGVNGVDWVVDAESDPYVIISYGRAPAVELRVPGAYGRDHAIAAVTDVGPVAAALPTTGRACVGFDDLPGGTARSGGTASPTARATDRPTVSATRSGG